MWGVSRRAGLRRVGWHVLRHTFFSHLAMRGVPLIVIQKLMGHSTIQMTMRYAHLAPDAHCRAVVTCWTCHLPHFCPTGQKWGLSSRNMVETPGVEPGSESEYQPYHYACSRCFESPA